MSLKIESLSCKRQPAGEQSSAWISTGGMENDYQKGMEFVDESGDYRIVRIEGKHSNDYAISIWKPAYDENDEQIGDLVHDHDTIMTAAEIRILANAKCINYEE